MTMQTSSVPLASKLEEAVELQAEESSVRTDEQHGRTHATINGSHYQETGSLQLKKLSVS
jgi:hypothetical protein